MRLYKPALFSLFFGWLAAFSLAFPRFLWDKSERLDRVAVFFCCLFGVLLPDRLWAYSIFFIIHISLVVLAFFTDATKKKKNDGLVYCDTPGELSIFMTSGSFLLRWRSQCLVLPR